MKFHLFLEIVFLLALQISYSAAHPERPPSSRPGTEESVAPPINQERFERLAGSITIKFEQCVEEFNPTLASSPFRAIEEVCKVRQAYLGCWDGYRNEIGSVCGNKSKPKIPKLYESIVKSMCGNDGGKKFAVDYEKVNEKWNKERENQHNPWYNWETACNTTIPLMNSPDSCVRQIAIDNCYAKIMCTYMHQVANEAFADKGQSLRCDLDF